jgi:hypothetical protein
MFEEMLAKYVMSETVYDVYAIYHSSSDQYVRKVAFYEVYEVYEDVVNKRVGSPLYTMPTWNEVYHNYYLKPVVALSPLPTRV